MRVESEKKALEIQARLRAEEIASKNLVDVMTEQVVQEMCQEVARGTVATYQMDLVTDDIVDSLIEEGIKKAIIISGGLDFCKFLLPLPVCFRGRRDSPISLPGSNEGCPKRGASASLERGGGVGRV